MSAQTAAMFAIPWQQKNEKTLLSKFGVEFRINFTLCSSKELCFRTDANGNLLVPAYKTVCIFQ